MRFWVQSFPAFRPLFEKVEIWSTEIEPSILPEIDFLQIKTRSPYWTIHAIDFQLRATRMLKRRGLDQKTIIFCSGCNVPVCDIRYLQFWHNAYLEEMRKRPDMLKMKLRQRLVSELVAHSENKVRRDPGSTQFWWTVSESLSARIEGSGARGRFRVLPNSYDDEVFNSRVVPLWRSLMRERYGIADHEIVLAFSSFGHFERKGLLQAVQAVNVLRQRGVEARLLILGGTASGIRSFRSGLVRRAIAEEGCIFAGLVENIEHHLSSADAFFFPSHFEAFSLAEIEAAALGLRLYLTPHYGSEMILAPPSNGQFLPWEPQGMAEIIHDDIRSGVLRSRHNVMGKALNGPAHAEATTALFREAIEYKSSHN